MYKLKMIFSNLENDLKQFKNTPEVHWELDQTSKTDLFSQNSQWLRPVKLIIT